MMRTLLEGELQGEEQVLQLRGAREMAAESVSAARTEKTAARRQHLKQNPNCRNPWLADTYPDSH